MDRLLCCAGLWLSVVSAVLFGMMGTDKRRARKGGRRVPERRLFVCAALGGAFGGWLGMLVFRHKTRHWTFRLGFPALALLQAALLLGLRFCG